jgi:hypothetical protein
MGADCGFPMAPLSIKLIVGGVTPTVSKNSRRENPAVGAPDFLRFILMLLSWLCVWQIYFPVLALSNTLLSFPLRCGEVPA